MVVVPFEFSVGCPDVCCQPIVYRVGIENVGSHFVCPFQVFVAMIVSVSVDGLPSVVAFLGANADETASFLSLFLLVIPFCKFGLEFVVPHVIGVEIKVFFSITRLGHFSDP